MTDKMWGAEPFWGLGYEWDPDWVLTDEQKELRALLISLCEQGMRSNAKEFDDRLEFPRRNFEILAQHGFLSLTVPKEFGGMGQNHACYSMVCETIARYGCASTAMCYVMHMGAVNTLMLRPTPYLIDKYIRRLDSDCLIGTLSYSDPETGSHFWYPISSGASRVEGGFDVRKKASWTTSAGFADWYVVQTTSPDFAWYDDLSVFVVDKEDAKAKPEQWDALGLRGNQSGSLDVNGFVPDSQLVGPVGDGAASNDESVDPWFLIGSSSVWNGIALGTLDIAKRHTTRKKHVDVGLRVCDYPTIQDYVGECLMDTNACRMFTLSVAQACDQATDDNTKVLGPGEFARAGYLHWAWQIKFAAAKNVAHVCDKMLHACGGSGYKRDMSIRNVRRSYGNVDILKGIDIEVEAGDFLILVEPESGCGKSTLLDTWSSPGWTSPPRAKSTSAGATSRMRCRRTATSPWYSRRYALYPNMTVRAKHRVRSGDAQVPPAGTRARPRASRKILQIERCSTASPRSSPAASANASRWARPRAQPDAVPVRRAAVQPRRQAARGDRAEIKQLHQPRRMTTVYVTHDQVEAMTLGDHIAVMKGGLIEQLGSPDEIYSRPATRSWPSSSARRR